MALIHEKMINIMREVGSISKDEKNKMQGFNFRGIDTVYNELHSILAKNGVFTTSEILEDKNEERQTKNGGNLIYRILKIKYTFWAEDGSCVYSTVIGEGMDSGDKASNKAMSVAHKYLFLQAYAIPTAEEKDPDLQSHEPSKPKQLYTQTNLKTHLDLEIEALITKTGIQPNNRNWHVANNSTKVDMIQWYNQKIKENGAQK